MRALIINEAAKARAAEVTAHAREHPYRPGGIGARPPGDDPRHVAQFGSYRAAFSFTYAGGGIWRHLSVSVPGDHYPNPAAAFMIAAELFGFSGWDGRTIDRAPEGWLLDVNKREHCVVLAQPIGSDGQPS